MLTLLVLSFNGTEIVIIRYNFTPKVNFVDWFRIPLPSLNVEVYGSFMITLVEFYVFFLSILNVYIIWNYLSSLMNALLDVYVP